MSMAIKEIHDSGGFTWLTVNSNIKFITSKTYRSTYILETYVNDSGYEIILGIFRKRYVYHS